jgi:hypothetical protein
MVKKLGARGVSVEWIDVVFEMRGWGLVEEELDSLDQVVIIIIEFLVLG